MSPADAYPTALRAIRLPVSVLVGMLAFALVAPAEAKAQADFDWPTPVIEEQEVTFTAAIDDRATHYTWDLNEDGTFGDKNGYEATRVFHNPRTYKISLRILDDQLNVIDEKTKDVLVQPAPGGGNAPPEASFVFFPAAPVAGLPVTFVSTSVDPDSPIPASAQRWDLNGDGAFDEATGESATVTFPAPGLYSVSLQVTTNKRNVATISLPVSAPVAGSVRAFGLMSPFPIVRIAGRTSRRGARIRRLSVDAPPGTSVKVRCQGRGCPFKSATHVVSMRASAGSLLPASRLTRVRRLEGRTLRTGALLRVFVTRSDVIGKYTRFRIRKSKPPARQDLCMVPGSTKPAPCPSR